MNDWGVALRTAYFFALGGNITYNGSVIPIVDEKLDVNITEHDIYILMLDQIEDLGTNSVKPYWSNECLFKMQVCNQRQGTNTKEVVEDISNQILTILFPTRLGTSLTLSSPFSLSYAKFLNAEYTPLVQNPLGFIITKTLTFKNRITQN